jgi:hypothetical protein
MMNPLPRWLSAPPPTGPPLCDLAARYCPGGLDGAFVALGLAASSVVLVQFVLSVYYYIARPGGRYPSLRIRLRIRLAWAWLISSCVVAAYYHVGLIANAVGFQMLLVIAVVIGWRALHPKPRS